MQVLGAEKTTSIAFRAVLMLCLIFAAAPTLLPQSPFTEIRKNATLHPQVSHNGGYTFDFIDPPGATETYAAGINDAGQIVGWYADSTGGHGFLDVGSNFTSINDQGAVETYAAGINKVGHIAGFYLDTEGKYHGFLDIGGNLSSFDYPGATNTFAYGINDPGQIVGYYFDTNGNFHGFVDDGSIDYPGATGTVASGINNLGQIVGEYFDSNGNMHGFLVVGDNFSSIDYPGAGGTAAYGINNLGQQIVGYYIDTNGKYHGFLDISDKFSSIDYSGGTATLAFGVNNFGQIVGTDDTNGLLATPLYLGVSGSNVKDIVRYSGKLCCGGGTLGSLVRVGNTPYILSNDHVLGLPSSPTVNTAHAGDAITQPGLLDNKCKAARIVGKFSLAPTLSSGVDAALAAVKTGQLVADGEIKKHWYSSEHNSQCNVGNACSQARSYDGSDVWIRDRYPLQCKECWIHRQAGLPGGERRETLLRKFFRRDIG
jgi:hypothetical protein